MSVRHHDDWLTIHGGDCREVLASLPAESVNCVVTSPPYWGLRDYGVAGQFGLEATPEEYVANMVAVFREVRRVLLDYGTLWLNLGDSYGEQKQLVGIPWRVAFALQADGWYLRSDIIWSKPNPMPESVTDRPTKAHEYVFLLTKSPRYFYDVEAVREPNVTVGDRREGNGRHAYDGKWDGTGNDGTQQAFVTINPAGRNRRSVWTIATKPYPGAHYAVMPEALVEPCVLAGCPKGGTVLDPFGGSGTVARVANRLSRRAVLIDLNPEYLDQQMKRNADIPLGLA